jgi:hypothetical protein
MILIIIVGNLCYVGYCSLPPSQLYITQILDHGFLLLDTDCIFGKQKESKMGFYY